MLPELNPNVSVPPHHLVKFEERLFSDRIKRLIDGEVKKLSDEDELELVESRIREFKGQRKTARRKCKFGGEIRNRIHSLMMRECRRLEDSYRQQIHHHQGRVLENSINGHGTVLELEACLKHEPSWRWDANAHVFVNLPFRASRKMDKIARVRILFRGTTNGNLG